MGREGGRWSGGTAGPPPIRAGTTTSSPPSGRSAAGISRSCGWGRSSPS